MIVLSLAALAVPSLIAPPHVGLCLAASHVQDASDPGGADTGRAHGEGPAAKGDDSAEQEAVEAMSRFTLPQGFRVNLFAAEPMLAHPVAFTIDALGRVFVAETFRHSQGVTDMREHMDWLEDDLAIKTVADRVAMFRRHETEEAFEAGYATHSERVTRLVDTDGDGHADESTVFAEGFDDPAAGIAAGLLAHPLPDGGTELWFTCIPSLWKLLDRDGDGVAEEREEHSTGYGLRVALLGHDLHGLVVGPDGRLYFSIGDRGFNVTTPEGEHLVRLGTGAVFRCELDGAGLEIFCDGLRNPQELVFDDYGNLFTLDNNSDGGDEARWTWLLEGSDTGWRQAYQWVTEPTSRGPWNEEGLWRPFTEEQPAYILPPIANFTSGPSGLTLYPGTGFGEQWRDTFFICDFRGSPAFSGIYSFRNERDRAGFKLVETERFVWDILPTDVDFGPDGSLYWSDWVNGWNRTGKGRIYRVTPEDRSEEEQAACADVAALLPRSLVEVPDDRLFELLAHRDRRVRQKAQLQLADRLRDPVALDLGRRALRSALDDNGPTMARLHLIWALGHAGRFNTTLGIDVAMALRDATLPTQPDVLVCLAGLLSDVDGVGGAAHLLELAEHPEPRVRLAAVQSLGRTRALEGALEAAILRLAAEGGSDPWMRTAAIRALERLMPDGLAFELHAESPVHFRRAYAVLARRFGDAERLAALLGDESQLVVAEAARAIYDTPVPGAMDALAVQLPKFANHEGLDDFSVRRALQANREVGTAEAAARVADFAAAHPGHSAAVEAVRLLIDWETPRTRDGILQDHRPIPAGATLDGSAGHALSGEAFARKVARGRTPEQLAQALVQWHTALAEGPETAASLDVLARSTELGTRARVAAFKALQGMPPDPRAEALLEGAVAGDPSLKPLWASAFATLPDERAAEVLGRLASEGAASERAEALRVLGALRGEAAAATFAKAGAALGPEAPLLVDWLVAAKDHPAAAVREVIDRYEAGWAASEDPLSAWRMCLAGGDAAAGGKIFRTKAETSCLKCHTVGGDGGSEAGPAMDGVGDRLAHEELLRSIVLPNDAIAEGYETWILGLDDGDVLSGRILEETTENLVLETAQKEVFDIPPGEIASRRRDVSGMPQDVSTHLSRTEMRDLIAFLASLRDPELPR